MKKILLFAAAGVMAVSLWGCAMEGLYTKKGPPLEGKTIGILPFGTTAELEYTSEMAAAEEVFVENMKKIRWQHKIVTPDKAREVIKEKGYNVSDAGNYKEIGVGLGADYLLKGEVFSWRKYKHYPGIKTGEYQIFTEVGVKIELWDPIIGTVVYQDEQLITEQGDKDNYYPYKTVADNAARRLASRFPLY